jgi:hypothetical protein
VLTVPRKSSLPFAAIAALVLAITLATGCRATQPASQAAPAAAAASIQLQPYTASDQSASAGVPTGWKVTGGQQTVIQMTGPEGETLSLGNTFVAQNAAFKPGQKMGNGIDLAMPYNATLAEKLTMIIQGNAAIAGKPAPQITINSSTPIQLPATLGQCSRFVASVTGDQGAMKVMAVFCSLPLDAGGDYKNIMLFAEAPAATAAQSAPTAQAIFQSYRIPTAWLQKKLAPVHAASAGKPTTASLAAGAADLKEAQEIMNTTNAGIAGADNSTNCFDLSVLRGTPTALLPRSCGGNAP